MKLRYYQPLIKRPAGHAIRYHSTNTRYNDFDNQALKLSELPRINDFLFNYQYQALLKLLNYLRYGDDAKSVEIVKRDDETDKPVSEVEPTPDDAGDKEGEKEAEPKKEALPDSSHPLKDEAGIDGTDKPVSEVEPTPDDAGKKEAVKEAEEKTNQDAVSETKTAKDEEANNKKTTAVVGTIAPVEKAKDPSTPNNSVVKTKENNREDEEGEGDKRDKKGDTNGEKWWWYFDKAGVLASLAFSLLSVYIAKQVFDYQKKMNFENSIKELEKDLSRLADVDRFSLQDMQEVEHVLNIILNDADIKSYFEGNRKVLSGEISLATISNLVHCTSR